MTVNQTDLDSFHRFATQLLAHQREDISLEQIVEQWHAQREREETLSSIRRGIADADAGRVRELNEVDAEIRSRLGFPPRRRITI